MKPPKEASKRVLILEDDATFGGIIESILGENGFQAVVISDVETAKKKLGHGIKFDVYSVDLRLGRGESGLDFIRSLPDQERRKVIIISSCNDGMMLDYTETLKINTFLEKSSVSSDAVKKLFNSITQDSESSPLHKYIKRMGDATGFLISLEDNLKTEFVSFIEPKRKCSICASTKTGCLFNCIFCGTGTCLITSIPRHVRNLTGWEFLSGISTAERIFDPKDPREIFVAGMGDGPDNLIIPAIAHYLVKKFSGLYSFKYSTIGVYEKLKKFLNELMRYRIPFGTQFSLHFAVEKKRKRYMPASSPIQQTLPLLIDYSIAMNTKLVLNYLVLKDLNDSDEDVFELKKCIESNLSLMRLMEKEKSRLHLSVFNKNPYRPICQAASLNKIEEIKNFLAPTIPVRIFESLGKGGLGCGELTASMSGAEILLD